MSSTILATLSAWTLAFLPLPGRDPEAEAESESDGPTLSPRLKTVHVHADDAPSNLFLPAGVGPHPVLLMDAADRRANLRAEAHRFASIGVAAFFRDAEDRASGRDALADVAARGSYVRGRIDINPYEVGALCFGEPADGWLEAAAASGASCLVRVTLRPDLAIPAGSREAAGPSGLPFLEVIAARAPLGPEATRLLDAWLLRQVTIHG